MIKIYRKTATIIAEQFDGSKEFARKYGIRMMPRATGSGIIDTLERTVIAHYGDWIATGINGEHWPISDEVFKKTYVELPVIPKVVADLMENYRKHESLTYLLSDAVTFHFENSGLDWIKRHDEAVARAWLDGYQVEEEDKDD